jgi:hypothetical protein
MCFIAPPSNDLALEDEGEVHEEIHEEFLFEELHEHEEFLEEQPEPSSQIINVLYNLYNFTNENFRKQIVDAFLQGFIDDKEILFEEHFTEG